jgi:hypothetical protein
MNDLSPDDDLYSATFNSEWRLIRDLIQNRPFAGHSSQWARPAYHFPRHINGRGGTTSHEKASICIFKQPARRDIGGSQQEFRLPSLSPDARKPKSFPRWHEFHRSH